MSESLPTEVTFEGTVGASVMVMSPMSSHPYYRANPSLYRQNDVLVSCEPFPRRPGWLTNKQSIINLLEKEIEILEKKLENKKRHLTTIKNQDTPLHEGRVSRQNGSLTLVHTQPEANLDVHASPTPTLKELVEMSTIDEGTGQVIDHSEDETSGSPAPSYDELLLLCPICD